MATTDEKKDEAAEQPTSETPLEGRYVVKPEFWDNLLDSIPPWGDEIAAIVLIVFGIVSFISLLDVSSDATISAAWSNALTSLFGYGSIVVAGGILAVGILVLLPKLGIYISFPSARVFALELAFLALLALLHLSSGDTDWRTIARTGHGGGIVGWGLSTIVGGLFSSGFAFLVYSLMLVVCLAYVAGLRLSQVSSRLSRTASAIRHFGQETAKDLPELPKAPEIVTSIPAPEPETPAPSPENLASEDHTHPA